MVALLAHSQMKPKIDEDGESYWVFESRDVGLLRLLRDLRNPISPLQWSTLTSLLALQTLWTQSGYLDPVS